MGRSEGTLGGRREERGCGADKGETTPSLDRVRRAMQQEEVLTERGNIWDSGCKTARCGCFGL